MREVITLRHRVVRVDIKLFAAVLRRFQQNLQIRGGVGLGREPQPHRWPAIFVFNGVEGLFVQEIIDINPFRVAGIRHSVVANEDDVYDVGKVASLQSCVEVLSEDINGLQRILLRSSEPVNLVGKF